jgi:hypothetical protein
VIPGRKPPAAMKSRDERLTVRLTPTERAEWNEAARLAGEEVSRYFRRCAVIGRKVREANLLGEATGA